MDRLNTPEYQNQITPVLLSGPERRKTLAMHSYLWNPGVKTARQALYSQNALILRSAEAVEASRCLDLGCGVGGTLLYLSETLQAAYAGISNSGVQIHLGSQEIQRRNKQQQIRLFQGDFNASQSFKPFPNQDLIFGVESLGYASSLETLIADVSGHLRQGGRFVVIDDVLTGDDQTDSELVRVWQRQARIPGLTTRDNLISLCARSGLVLADEDELTPFLKEPLFQQGQNALAYALLSGNSEPPAPGEFRMSQHLRGRLRREGRLAYEHLVFVKS